MNDLDYLYYVWLLKNVCDIEEISDYECLFKHLFNEEFRFLMDLDENCAIYGLELRELFLENSVVGRIYMENGQDFSNEFCSILELLVSLAMHMESEIMSNDSYGDRTSLWFWDMIESLGLKKYENERFDAIEIDAKLDIFMDRRHSKTGKGGLFTIKNSKIDMRNVDIWAQAMKYLSEIAVKNGEIW